MKNLKDLKESGKKRIIKDLTNTLRSLLDSTDKQTIIRKGDIYSRHLLYCECLRIENNMSYQQANSVFKLKNILDVSHQALNNKIITGKFSDYFRRINE